MTWRVNFMLSKDAQKQLARTSLKLKSLRSDEKGKYLILKANIQDVTFLLINV